MKKSTRIIKDFRSGMSKHGSHILFGIGLAGAVGTIISAVKETPKAITILDEQLDMRGLVFHAEEVPKQFAFKEKVKLTWKCYIPTVITGTMSAACLICSHTRDTKRNAALATAYALTEATLNEYRNKVIDVVGEKQERVVRDAVAKDRVEKNPVENREVIITKKGDTLCYESISGRYFKSDIEQIRRAANEMNSRLNQEMYISLNDLYDEIGLKNVAMGYEIGWNISTGLIDIYFSSTLSEDGTPCLVIGYNNAPKYGFDRFG